MNTKVKFLQIMLSDLVSERDTLELELNRVLNDTEADRDWETIKSIVNLLFCLKIETFIKHFV